MTLPTLLALALLAAPYEPHGRLTLSARAGGGWASDPYPGGRLGGGALAELAPAAVLDLALSPTVKAAIDADASWSVFRASGFEARGAGLGAEARLLRGPRELAFAVRGDAAWFPEGAPADEGAASPRVTRTLGLSGGPTLRVRAERLSGWVGAAGALGAHRAGGGEDVRDRGVAAEAGGRLRLSERLALSAEAVAERTFSARPEFASRATAAALAATARPWRALEVAARASLRHTAFDAGVDEDQLRGALDLSHPAGPVTAVVALSTVRASTAERVATRHLVYAGVRGSLRALAW